jgi:hypothetical protein
MTAQSNSEWGTRGQRMKLVPVAELDRALSRRDYEAASVDALLGGGSDREGVPLAP